MFYFLLKIYTLNIRILDSLDLQQNAFVHLRRFCFFLLFSFSLFYLTLPSTLSSSSSLDKNISTRAIAHPPALSSRQGCRLFSREAVILPEAKRSVRPFGLTSRVGDPTGHRFWPFGPEKLVWDLWALSGHKCLLASRSF